MAKRGPSKPRKRRGLGSGAQGESKTLGNPRPSKSNCRTRVVPGWAGRDAKITINLEVPSHLIEAYFRKLNRQAKAGLTPPPWTSRKNIFGGIGKFARLTAAFVVFVLSCVSFYASCIGIRMFLVADLLEFLVAVTILRETDDIVIQLFMDLTIIAATSAILVGSVILKATG